MSPTPPRQEGWTCDCGTWNESFRTICRGCQTAALATFEFPATGQPVRTVTVDGRPGFVAKDACDVIGISKYRDAVAQLDEDERASMAVDTPGGKQVMTVVTEAGLYALMMISRSPRVKPFRRWVTHEVLPAIRQTGSYAVAPQFEIPKTYADALELAARQAREIEAKTARMEKAEGAMREIEGADGLTIRMFHKKYFSETSERDFFEHLYAKGYLIDQRGKGSFRPDGTVRDGSQHRHPSYKGKPYLYLHFGGIHGDKRREYTRVRPGQPELDFKAVLVREGLVANDGNDGGLFAIEGGA